MAYRSRERVARILAHEEADRVPFDSYRGPGVRALLDAMDLSPDQRECYTEGDFRYLHFRLPEDRTRFEAYLPGLPAEARLSPWGVGRVAAISADGYVAGSKLYHPLAEVNTIEELERFPFPDVTAPECHEHLPDAVQAAKEDQFTVLGQMSQTILETAYEMRGMERLFVDMFERPDYVRALFGQIAERRRFQARRFAQAGVDVLRIGDDIATQTGLLVSPETYREWIKPLHADVVAAAREVNPNIQVLYHSDGMLTPLLPDLIEVGVTAINPAQPECMPPAEIKREFGDCLTLWGCITTQSTYAHGTADQVVEDLRMLITDVAPQGGLVISFINVLQTDRLMENLRRFYSVMYDIVRYR